MNASTYKIGDEVFVLVNDPITTYTEVFISKEKYNFKTELEAITFIKKKEILHGST